MSTQTIELDGHGIEVEHFDKVFFPDVGLTKGDLIGYYRRIAETMLPHLEGRPLTMQRFPDGIDEKGFYQKEAPGYFPDWIQRVEIHVEGEGSTQPQVVCGNVATLVYLVDQGCITPHVWLSRVAALHKPDKLIFDLDPPDDDFEMVRHGALALHDLLDEIDLTTYLMTTGSRGLHVVAPLDGSAEFDTVRQFARDVGAVLARREPDRITVESRKQARRGRLFVDYLRNSYAQNAVAPYAVRAKPGAPVATPLDWDELGDRDLAAQTYTTQNIFRRLGQKDDPWADFQQHAQSLEEPRQKLKEMED
ncbi:MAG: non-homologous end-joining DNA ligase [Anaerolineae bacterium]